MEKKFSFAKAKAFGAFVVFLCSLTSVAIASYDDDEKLPTYLEGRVGGFVIFNCKIEFPDEYPIPYNLFWRKDHKLIFAWYGDNVQVNQQYTGRIKRIEKHASLGEASINLTSVRESDSGWYECKLAFPNRTPQTRDNGTWFNLTVDGGTLMKIPPVNQTILEYDQAFFHCSVKNPETMFVTWYKDGELLDKHQDLISRTIVGADGSLLITPTLMNDLGLYSCKVKNNLGDEETAEAFLNVQYKAKVVYAPKEIFLAHGHQAVLDCHFRSNPGLKSLRWEKDGFLFDPYNVKDVFYKPNGSLHFSNVNDLHGGKYTCTPYNELGTEGPSSIINVLIQHPPEFTVEPNSVYIRKLLDSVTLHCSARDKHTEDDRCLIEWSRKDGLPLPIGRSKISGGNLTIERLTGDDRGVYTCTASNEAAKIHTDSEIMVESFSPKSPSNLTANSSSTAITIRWTQNYIRPYLKFFVLHRLVNTKVWREDEFESNNNHEATISDLEPSNEYEFKVVSQDLFNDGLVSKTYKFRTKAKDEESEDFQSKSSAFSHIGPPKNVSVDPKPGKYLVTWNSPDHGQESLGLYKVRWYLEPEHKLHGTADTLENFYELPENVLDDGVIYSFQVSSVSTTNYEALSTVYELRTPHYRVVQAITVGAVGLLVLLSLAGVLFYMKRNLFKNS